MENPRSLREISGAGLLLRDRYIRDNKNTAHCTATEATGVATGRGAPANCIDVQCIRIKLVYG